MFTRLTVVATVALSGCYSPDEHCFPSSNDDLRAIAANGASLCEAVTVRETELRTLEGLEGLRSVGDLHVERNAFLEDFSAIQGLRAGTAVFAENKGAEAVQIGPVGGAGVAFADNNIRELYVEVLEDTLLTVNEPDLSSLHVGGDVTAEGLFVTDTTDARFDVTVEPAIRKLKVIGATWAVSSADLIPMGIPMESAELFGTGLMPGSPSPAAYYETLVERGFDGTLLVCESTCDALAELAYYERNCGPDGTWRAACESFGG